MKLLADMHIAPRTVAHLRQLGHDVLRVDDVLPPTASDPLIITTAKETGRIILTQDLDFSALIALSGHNSPSLISLRLASVRVEYVNAVLQEVLPQIEPALQKGSMVTIEGHAVRVRPLPLG